MDMKELKTFVTLAEVLNYQKASGILNYAPSTLAHHIQIIEGELNKRLFDREGRNLTLTEDGEKFAAYAGELLALYQDAVNSLSAEGEVARVAIAGSEATTGYCIGDILSHFAEGHPNIHLELFGGPNSATPDLVSRGIAELGFYYAFDRAHLPGIRDIALFREPNALICLATNPLAVRTGLHYEDLAGASFAFPHDDCLCAVDILEKLKQRGVTYGSISCPGSMPSVIDLAVRDGAILSLPYSAGEYLARHHNMAILDLDEEKTWVYARALFRQRAKLSLPAQDLLAFVRNCAAVRRREQPALCLEA